jgi:hypothetical protein
MLTLVRVRRVGAMLARVYVDSSARRRVGAMLARVYVDSSARKSVREKVNVG